jgi:hypothetical protein
MHFIVGHPRSGTHLLADLLNAAGPKVAMHEAFVELSPEESFIALATDYYEGRAGADVVKESIRSYPLPAAIRIDANWKNTWVLPVLLEMYPEARVLHLTRDPRRNVLACHNMGYYSAIGFNPAFPIYSNWLQAMPVVARADWQWLSVFERNCAFWVESHRLALEARTSLGARYARIKMEELRDPETIARLFAFFRMAVPPAEAIERVLAKAANPQARIKAYVESEFANMQLPAFEDCPLPLQEVLARICAPMALELGYRLP